MSRFPLTGGAYQSRTVIANAQRCVNLYPEINPAHSPVPVTYYQVPGKRLLVPNPFPGNGGARCLYLASNGTGYYVAGNRVYVITLGNTLDLLGTINTSTGICSMADNGTYVWLVDGSDKGWTIKLSDNSFALFVDPTGTFTGATKVDYLDTYLLWNFPGTDKWGSTLSNTLTIDPTYIATKTTYPDPLQTIIVNKHEIHLLGTLKSEIWFDAGGALFPFAELPGAYFEHGTVAKYSCASSDIHVYFLSQDYQGQGMVLRIRGYEMTKISNHALDYQIRKMYQNGGNISDAVGYCYQQDGHLFYVLNFPSADQTWVWDEATQEWHQRAWVDNNGALHRDRVQCCAPINGLMLGGDWETGDLLVLDQTVYSDYVAGRYYPQQCIRGFPHLMQGMISLGLPGYDKARAGDGKVIQVESFQLDLQCGTGVPAEVIVRWSNDRGLTFVNSRLLALGNPGQYAFRPLTRNLGQTWDFVFEIQYSIDGEAACQGAWVTSKVLEQ